MIKTRLKNTFAIWFTVLVSGICVSAQTDITVSIQNTSGEDRKVCFYNSDDQVGLVPKTCVTMKKNQVAMWQNKGNIPFMVKIFKPGILDEYIDTRRLPGNTDKIIVAAERRFGFSTRKPPKRYFLKVCNQQWDEKIYFVLGFETQLHFWTEGWWTLEKGKCMDFPVSEKLKSKYGIDYGYFPRVHYYAQIKKQGQTLEWKGGENAPDLCINMSNAFAKEQFQKDASGILKPLPCNGTSDKFVRFRSLTGSDTTYPAFNLQF